VAQGYLWPLGRSARISTYLLGQNSLALARAVMASLRVSLQAFSAIPAALILFIQEAAPRERHCISFVAPSHQMACTSSAITLVFQTSIQRSTRS
jgi:uncharacterized membrane protein